MPTIKIVSLCETMYTATLNIYEVKRDHLSGIQPELNIIGAHRRNRLDPEVPELIMSVTRAI